MHKPDGATPTLLKRDINTQISKANAKNSNAEAENIKKESKQWSHCLRD